MLAISSQRSAFRRNERFAALEKQFERAMRGGKTLALLRPTASHGFYDANAMRLISFTFS
jgi:hypothetical protein